LDGALHYSARIGGKLIGIWLLGRRDPDDFYAQSEISVLQTISNQTAIALNNIAHAELLHALYQADIERQEKERAALARGLHDEVLNQLAVLFIRQPSPADILRGK
jgi:GAF domain-containing protein